MRGEPNGPPFAELAPSQQVVLVDHHGDWVGVQPLGDDQLGVVPRSYISELAGPPPLADVPCDAIEVDPAASQHRH